MVESIYETVKPFYYLAKFTGFASFTIVGKATDGKIKTTIWDILILLIFIFLPNYNVINFLALDRKSFQAFPVVGRHYIVYFYNIASSFFVLHSYTRREALWNILRHIHLFDEEIQSLGYSVNHKKHQRFVWCYIIATIMLILITLGLIMSRRTFVARTLVVYLSGIIAFIQFGSFQLCLILANSRLNDLNICLKNLFLYQKRGFKHLRNKELNDQVLKTVNLNHILNEAINSINHSFCFVSLVCFALYFVFLILIVFSIFRAIYSNRTIITPLLLTTYSYIFLFYFCYVIGILIAANGITGKVQCTN